MDRVALIQQRGALSCTSFGQLFASNREENTPMANSNRRILTGMAGRGADGRRQAGREDRRIGGLRGTVPTIAENSASAGTKARGFEVSREGERRKNPSTSSLLLFVVSPPNAKLDLSYVLFQERSLSSSPFSSLLFCSLACAFRSCFSPPCPLFSLLSLFSLSLPRP